VPNFPAFLLTGLFIFNFTQRAFLTTSRVMPDSLPLIRALPFPRGCLPIGYVLIELEQLFMAMVVLIVIVLATGEPLTWYWLLAIPALALQAVFNVGMGLFLARLGAGADDFSQLLPFLVRTWMYTSGVMFSIQTIKTLAGHPTLTWVLQINPAAVYISLVRNAILQSQRNAWPGSKPYNAANCALYHSATAANAKGSVLELSAYCHGTVTMTGLWLWGIGWAIAALVIGFVFFWQAETRYGRG
jgi:teichoic acid transport system permease protein